MIRGDGFAVVAPGEGTIEALPSGAGSIRVTIDDGVGCRNLVQRLVEIRRPGWGEHGTPGSEEIGYVASGTGRLVAGDQTLALEEGTGFLVPPSTPFQLVPDGGRLMVISVLSPPPRTVDSVPAGEAAQCMAVRAAQQERLPAGASRHFKLLVDPSVGCRHVTQFVGYIEQSRAPGHVHPYEEVVHVLEGEGTLHAAGERIPFGRGTGIFLAPGTPHCLENGTLGTLQILGVFSPAGSPADKREQ
jgi:mannose-6-phosphate isomerase-like protein (cupin superfamily)